jgi:hypothetical protein
LARGWVYRRHSRRPIRPASLRRCAPPGRQRSLSRVSAPCYLPASLARGPKHGWPPTARAVQRSLRPGTRTASVVPRIGRGLAQVERPPRPRLARPLPSKPVTRQLSCVQGSAWQPTSWRPGLKAPSTPHSLDRPPTRTGCPTPPLLRRRRPSRTPPLQPGTLPACAPGGAARRHDEGHPRHPHSCLLVYQC